MTRDALVVLRAGSRAWRNAARRTPVEQLVLAVVVAVACGWAVRAATHDVLTSFGPQQTAGSLATVATVTAVLVTGSAFAASSALRPELAPFAHRITGRGLLASRSLVAGVTGTVAGAALLALVGAGSPLRPGDVARLLVHLPAGAVTGLGAAAGVEALVRAVVRTDDVVLLSRLGASSVGLGVAAALVTRPTRWPLACSLGAVVWVGVAVSGGLAPLRPRWLGSRRQLRRGPRVTRSVATHPFWHPLCLLARDALALPLTAGLVVVVGAAGAVGRLDTGASLSQLYVAIWALLVVVPASAMGLVVAAKASPPGGGLVGHRVLPGQVARSALTTAVVAAVGVLALGAVVTSVAGGAVLPRSDVGRLAVVTVVATCLALATAAVRPVRAAVVDLPAATSLAHLGTATVVVAGLDSASWPWVAVAAVVAVPAAAVLTVTAARRRAPFSR